MAVLVIILVRRCMKKIHIKVFFIALEIAYIIGVMMVVFVAASLKTFDYLQAALVILFTLAAIFMHDQNTRIEWK